MVENGMAWIYLIFLLVPLAKILPRVMNKLRSKKSDTIEQSYDNQFQVSNNTISETPREIFGEKVTRESKPLSTDMLVLAELNHGTKNFDVLQRKLGFDTETLNSILEELENLELVRVEQKQGLLGPKIELFSTEKGTRKYYS